MYTLFLKIITSPPPLSLPSSRTIYRSTALIQANITTAARLATNARNMVTSIVEFDISFLPSDRSIQSVPFIDCGKIGPDQDACQVGA